MDIFDGWVGVPKMKDFYSESVQVCSMGGWVGICRVTLCIFDGWVNVSKMKYLLHCNCLWVGGYMYSDSVTLWICLMGWVSEC